MFVSRGPIDYAMKGMRLLPDLSLERDWELSHEELIIHNDQAFRSFVEGLTRRQSDEAVSLMMPRAGYGT
jgi:hypothetical protein